MEKPDSTNCCGSYGCGRVFIDTSLDTHMLIGHSCSDTVSDFKKKIEYEHSLLFPNIGKIKVNSLQVERGGQIYILVDNVILKYLFAKLSGDRLLRVEAHRQKDDANMGNEIRVDDKSKKNSLKSEPASKKKRKGEKKHGNDENSLGCAKALISPIKRQQVSETNRVPHSGGDDDKDNGNDSKLGSKKNEARLSIASVTKTRDSCDRNSSQVNKWKNSKGVVVNGNAELSGTSEDKEEAKAKKSEVSAGFKDVFDAPTNEQVTDMNSKMKSELQVKDDDVDQVVNHEVMSASTESTRKSVVEKWLRVHPVELVEPEITNGMNNKHEEEEEEAKSEAAKSSSSIQSQGSVSKFVPSSSKRSYYNSEGKEDGGRNEEEEEGCCSPRSIDNQQELEEEIVPDSESS